MECIPNSVPTINSGSLKVERKLKRERAPGGVYFKLSSHKQSGVRNRRWMVKSGRVLSGVQRMNPKLSTNDQLGEHQSREGDEERKGPWQSVFQTQFSRTVRGAELWMDDEEWKSS